MDLFRKHEEFEIEVLDKLNSGKFLDILVFGGGTMLRLCHNLPRYSADLDFWIIKKISDEKYFKDLSQYLAKSYVLTDGQIKVNTLLLELKSRDFPRKLKIEIRRIVREWDYQNKIAYSRFATNQVMLKTHTLEQTMTNKLEALLGRKEIRDAFDIEFLLRRGSSLPGMSSVEKSGLRKILSKFTDNDFKVTLGSVLESDVREYYIQNKFELLLGKIRNS